MKHKLESFLLAVMLLVASSSFAKAASRYYYQIKVYHLKTTNQQERVERYLQQAYLPALHRAGIKSVGVFTPIEADTADKRLYVFIPFSTWNEMGALDQKLASDRQYQTEGKDYLEASYDNAPYSRLEVITLQAFPKMIAPAKPVLSSPMAERVYELRSYESPTENYNVNKVKMFNDGDEVGLFKRLNFNAVFYAEVLSGSRMPNLMYMTTFNSKADRDKHWEAFSNDPQWKKLIAMPEYEHNVSKADIIFLRPANYSDF